MGNGLTKKSNAPDMPLEEKALELCRSLERGGEKITDSAIALGKSSVLRH